MFVSLSGMLFRRGSGLERTSGAARLAMIKVKQATPMIGMMIEKNIVGIKPNTQALAGEIKAVSIFYFLSPFNCIICFVTFSRMSLNIFFVAFLGHDNE